MSILSNLFGKKTPSAHTFPEEGNEGSIGIKGGRIVSKGANSFWDCEIVIAELQYIYLIADEHQKSNLFLFDGHQNHLPVTYKGFKEAYLFLSGHLKLNDEVFFESLHKKGPQRQEIWRKASTQTYQILDQAVYDDYPLGFEVQSPVREFISWDTTYDQLLKSPNLFFKTSSYGQKMGRFRHSVRVGNVLFKDFEIFFDNERKDVPILHFYADCFSENSSDQSYKDLKNRLVQDLGKSNSYYERSDQNYYSFNVQQMHISLVYTYDSDYQLDGGSTSLSIKNQRDYPALLENESYEKEMSIDQVISLSPSIRTPDDYKRNPDTKRRPPKLDIAYKKKTVIWKDEQNKKIGFADQFHTQIFELQNVKSFSVENMLPAKGGGMGYLNIQFHKGKSDRCILTGDCHAMDGIADQLTELSGKPVTFLPEYYNC